jgi:hypothetical protein
VVLAVGLVGIVGQILKAVEVPSGASKVFVPVLFVLTTAGFGIARYRAKKDRERLALQEEQREQAQGREVERQRIYQEGLAARFGPENANRILAKEVWVGATKDMILEAFGKPDEITEKVLKTKTKRIFKYRDDTSGRFALKITLDDDEVVGWEK